MIFQADEYAKGNYPFPDRENRKIDKDSEEYNLQVAQSVYSQFCAGSTLISGDAYTTVRRNREYADGNQDQNIYKDVFYGTDNANGTLDDFSRISNSRHSRRKAYANLNFSIQSPMPRVMDSVVNKLSELVGRVSVDGQDQYSGAERENMKWGTYVDGKFKQQLDSLKLIMNLPTEEKRYTPKNIEELNLYEAEGGFKLAYEETMERLLKYAFEQSLWEENIVELVLKDLVTLGYAVVEDYYDKYTGQVKTRYIDAEYAGVQYTRQEANYDPDFGFYVDMVKLSNLRKKGFPLDKLTSIGKVYSGQFGNPNFEDYNKENKNSQSYKDNGMDEYVVPVFVVKWKDVEHKIEKQYKNRQGKLRTRHVDSKYKFKNSEKEILTRVVVNRETHWVVASDLVYDFGKCEFQARDGKNDSVLPIHMVQVTSRPLVSRLIPSLDQYMNGWMKLQQGLSMAAMNGYAINMDAVSNLQMGTEKLHPKEVLRMWRQTGNLFFKPTDVAGRPNMGQVRPIEQLTGGAGAVIAEAVQIMDISMRQVEELTGINPVSMGAQPTADQGKAVTEFSIMGTNDILKGILKRANILKSNTARAMCLRLSHVVDADTTAYNTYKEIVGETALELLKIASGHDVKYGIRTHARPTQGEVQAIRDMLVNALKNGRDGKARINEADYIRFEGMLLAGESLKRIALLLDFALEKAQESETAKSMQLQQEQIKGTQMLEAQKAQQRERDVMLETQSEIAKENIKGRNTILAMAVSGKEMTAAQALAMLGGQQIPQAQPQETPIVQQEQQQREPIPSGQEPV